MRCPALVRESALALIVLTRVLRLNSNLNKGNRRIFLITDDDDPCRAKAEREEAGASQRPSQRLTPRKKKAGMYSRFPGPEQVTDIERTSDRIKVCAGFASLCGEASLTIA